MFAKGMNHMTPSLVTPGMNVSSTADCEAGEGTIEVDGRIVATAVGAFSIIEGVGTVMAAKAIVTPEVGDTVLCEITRLNEKEWGSTNPRHRRSNW